MYVSCLLSVIKPFFKSVSHEMAFLKSCHIIAISQYTYCNTLKGNMYCFIPTSDTSCHFYNTFIAILIIWPLRPLLLNLLVQTVPVVYLYPSTPSTLVWLCTIKIASAILAIEQCECHICSYKFWTKKFHCFLWCFRKIVPFVSSLEFPLDQYV